jgi:4'-phosphopantetheinyl transferase
MHQQGRPDPMGLPAAQRHAVRLWHASLEYPGWQELLPLLSAQEADRANRFAFERDARRYVASHAALRWLLGHLTGMPPKDVALRTGPTGKPVVGDGGEGLHFSLSRSGDHVLIGVAAQPLGVDIECLATSLDVAALAEVALSAREGEVFEQAEPALRRELFMRCWTRKEAILKATGQGLSVPPSAVEVLLAPGDALGHQAVVTWLGTSWQVDTVLPEPGYVGAVAVASSRRPGLPPGAGLGPRVAALSLRRILHAAKLASAPMSASECRLGLPSGA